MRKLLVSFFKLFDAILMIAAFMLAELAALHHNNNVPIREVFAIRIKIHNFVIFLLFIFAWNLIFNLLGLYASRRLSNRRDEIFDIIKATSLGTLVILLGASIFHIRMVTPLFLIVFWLISMCSTVCARLLVRTLLAFVRQRGRNLRIMIIVGTSGRALEFANNVMSHTELGYRIAGFVDHDWDGMEAFRATGFTLVADFDTFARFLRNTVVDEVVMALPFRSMHAQAARIAALCEEQGITVRVLNNIFDFKIAHSFTEELEGDGLITHSTGGVEGWPLLVKRLLDVTISAASITLLSPTLLIVAIMIKINSPGPVFFVQKRLGLNKRHFRLYKFRTMVMDAEKQMVELEHLNEVSGPVFKIKNDPRITSLGRLLRKTSIDEFPQLFNVLRGDMSLVGPRPLPLRDYEGFNEDWQRRRFSVKPGVTCLWQVQGRSSIPFERWMELDLQYIDKWSLGLDLQILLLTIPAVLRGSGAA